jgi:hypothetical protein
MKKQPMLMFKGPAPKLPVLPEVDQVDPDFDNIEEDTMMAVIEVSNDYHSD